MIGPAVPGPFPPESKAAVVHLACQQPGSAVELTTAPQDDQLAKTQMGQFLSQDDQGKWWVTVPVSRLSSAMISLVLVGLTVVASISRRTVARWLKAERIKPWRFRSWITPKSLPEFLARARAVLDLYARVSSFRKDEIAWSIDECTSLQARARDSLTPPVPGEGGSLVESSYARRGAVQLFAALNVATGYLKAAVKSTKNFDAFRSFIVELIEFSQSLGKKVIHLVLDNGSTHRPAFLQGWLAESYPNLTVIVTWLPVRSSWLNQIEIFFSILKDHVLKLNAYDSLQLLTDRIVDFIEFRNRLPTPFKWDYTVEDLFRKYGLRSESEIWSSKGSEIW